MSERVKAITILNFLIALVCVLFTVQSSVSASNRRVVNERLKRVIEKTAVSIQSESPPFRAQTVATENRKTPTRIVSFTHELSESEKNDLSTKYDIVFGKKSSRHNRYVVTPKDELKFTELSKTENEVTSVSNDEVYKVLDQTEDWGINGINAPAAWHYTTPSTGNSIVVAVIDTGVQLDHPDLIGSIQLGGYDYVDNDSVPEDDHGHGTHVAGIIAATNNSVGTVGVAYDTKILPMRVCSANGEDTICSSLAIADAIDDAVAANVDIINMSLGGSANSLIQASVNAATQAGIIVVAAAGNSNVNGCIYPAAYENVVCVGAIDSSDAKASFGNFGTGLDVVAPGVAINSLGLASSYTLKSGTSMATAYYSGAAAIVKSMINALCVAEPANVACADRRTYVQTILNLTTSRDLGIAGFDANFGNGAIDLSQLFSDTVISHTSPTTLLTQGVSKPQPITVTNSNTYSIGLTACTVMSKNLTRTQTVPSFTLTQLTQGATIYSSPILNTQYTTFTFPTPIVVNAGATANFSYNFLPSAESASGDQIQYSFTCQFDNNSTISVEKLHSDQVFLTATSDLPTTLKNVYFTFGKLIYNRSVPTSQLRALDTVYLKNFDPKKVKLTQFFLYDYIKKGNQGFTKYPKTSTSFMVRTNYLLPRGRQYAYIAEFQDIATGVKIKKYFVFRTN